MAESADNFATPLSERFLRVLALLSVTLFMACLAPPVTQTPATTSAPADTVRIDGSAGVMPLVAAIAREYRAVNPSAAIVMGGGLGSSARIQALIQHKIDIAVASHGVAVDELAKQGLAAHEIAKVAVVFAVNASVPLTNLTETQLCDLYRGSIANWRELGGPELAVAPRTRPVGEVDADVVLAGVGCLRQMPMAGTVTSIEKPEDMAAALAATAGAVGMTSLPFVEQSGGRVRALSLGGVAPSAQNVRSGAYALTRQSFLLTHASPSPAVSRFLAFVRSAIGSRAIAASGAVPVP